MLPLRDLNGKAYIAQTTLINYDQALPRETAVGSLCAYISGADPAGYQPANITFDLLPPLEEEARRALRHDKKARHALVCRSAEEALNSYLAGEG